MRQCPILTNFALLIAKSIIMIIINDRVLVETTIDRIVKYYNQHDSTISNVIENQSRQRLTSRHSQAFSLTTK